MKGVFKETKKAKLCNEGSFIKNPKSQKKLNEGSF